MPKQRKTKSKVDDNRKSRPTSRKTIEKKNNKKVQKRNQHILMTISVGSQILPYTYAIYVLGNPTPIGLLALDKMDYLQKKIAQCRHKFKGRDCKSNDQLRNNSFRMLINLVGLFTEFDDDEEYEEWTELTKRNELNTLLGTKNIKPSDLGKIDLLKGTSIMDLSSFSSIHIVPEMSSSSGRYESYAKIINL